MCSKVKSENIGGSLTTLPADPTHHTLVLLRRFMSQSIPTGRFSRVGRDWRRSPHELYAPFITAVSPIKNLKIAPPPPPISVDHDKNFFRYFFNLCMTKANLTSMTSLRMQTLPFY